MNTRSRWSAALLGCCLLLAATAPTRAVGATTALLATLVSADEGDADRFVLAHVADTTGRSPTATLGFDLRALPRGVALESVVLRLVPADAPVAPHRVVIGASDGFKPLIGQLVVAGDGRPVESVGTALAGVVGRLLVDPADRLTLHLRTDSPGTRQAFHGPAARDPANRPRLVVSWADPSAAVERHGAWLHDRGRSEQTTPWRNHRPAGALLAQPLARRGFERIVGPVFRDDEMVVIATPPGGPARCLGIGWNGALRWERELPALPAATAAWSHLRVDAQGRVLAFASRELVAVLSDFGPGGPATRQTRSIDGLLLSSRPAVGAGGIVALRNDGDGLLYGLGPAPGLDVLWRSSRAVGLSTPPVASPARGDGLFYAIAVDDTRDGRGIGLVVVDAARGQKPGPIAFPERSQLGGFSDFHPPLAAEGRDHDWVFLAGYGETTGRLEGYSDFTAMAPSAWATGRDGPVSRCIAPPARGGRALLYCVQDGRLRGFARDNGSVRCESAADAAPLSATTNLVADGDGNLYFWDEREGAAGLFHGFAPDCSRTLETPLPGLPQAGPGEAAELVAGADGLFYLNLQDRLFSIRLSSGDADPALVAGTRQAVAGSIDASRRARPAAPTEGPVALEALGGRLSLGDLQVPPGADLSALATTGISFAPGFAVSRGGVLRCGIVGTDR